MTRGLPSTRLDAFRLIDGPCHGQIAELPPDGFDEVWRCTPDEDLTYASYTRDGAVFRYSGQTISGEELVARLKEHVGAEITMHADSREYER